MKNDKIKCFLDTFDRLLTIQAKLKREIFFNHMLPVNVTLELKMALDSIQNVIEQMQNEFTDLGES